jgi:hypothetical protein
MDSGRRTGLAAVPTNLDSYLSDQQLAGLRTVERIGWQVRFIRRPAFEAPTVVLAFRNGKRMALLQDDGRLDERASIYERSNDTHAPLKFLV